MTVSDLKLYALNFLSFLVSMTAIEPFLKIVLLIVSIGYTINKWIQIKSHKDGE
jgi:hypothetical protein